MGLVHADFACELIHPLNKIPNISIAKKFRNQKSCVICAPECCREKKFFYLEGLPRIQPDTASSNLRGGTCDFNWCLHCDPPPFRGCQSHNFRTDTEKD